MNCAMVQKRLSAFQDGELDHATGSAIQAHLLDCPQCSRVAAELKGVYGWMAEPDTLPADLFMISRVRAAVTAPRRTGAPAGKLNRLLIPATVAAGLAIGVLLGAHLSTHWPGMTQDSLQSDETVLYSQMRENSLTSNYLQITWQEGRQNE